MTSKLQDLRERLDVVVLEHGLDYLPGWLKTLGEVGSDKKVDARTRANAAKVGIELIRSVAGEGPPASAQGLLKQLGDIESAADAADQSAAHREKVDAKRVNGSVHDLD